MKSRGSDKEKEIECAGVGANKVEWGGKKGDERRFHPVLES